MPNTSETTTSPACLPYSPAPWIIAGEYDCSQIESANGCAIAVVWKRSCLQGKIRQQFTNGEGEANARLIVAAPEMYEALKTAYMALFGIVSRNAVVTNALDAIITVVSKINTPE